MRQNIIDVDSLELGDKLVIHDHKSKVYRDRLFFSVMGYRTLLTGAGGNPLVTAFKPDTIKASTRGRSLVFSAKDGYCSGAKRYTALGIYQPELLALAETGGAGLLVDNMTDSLSVTPVTISAPESDTSTVDYYVISLKLGLTWYHFDILTGHSEKWGADFKLCPVTTSLLYMTPKVPDYTAKAVDLTALDMADIKGFEHVKRALEIASAGGHSLGLIGSNLGALAMFKAQADRFGISVFVDTPCECGWYGDDHMPCECYVKDIALWQQRPTFTFAWGADLVIDPGWVDFCKMSALRPGESTAEILARVESARKVDIDPPSMGHLDSQGQRLFKSYMAVNKADQIAIERMIAIGRTIANLDQSEHVQLVHLAESLQYQKETIK